MFVSCDTDGRIVISKIYSLAFKILQVDKIVAVDPAKELALMKNLKDPFWAIATRFASDQFPQGKVNDTATIMAYASNERLVIEMLEEKKT